MPAGTLELTKVPSVKVGMLVRREPAEVFKAIADPGITSKIWYTKSSGKMTPGAELLWEWEMYGLSSQVTGDELVSYVTDSTGGFTFLVSALKALLEHDIVLGLVPDALQRACQPERACRQPARGRGRLPTLMSTPFQCWICLP